MFYLVDDTGSLHKMEEVSEEDLNCMSDAGWIVIDSQRDSVYGEGCWEDIPVLEDKSDS